MTRVLSIAAAVAVVVASLGVYASPAAAHESRNVGPYTFVVGWVNEPAIVAQPNGLDVTVTETASGKPVEGLDKTLKAEVSTGGGANKKSLDLAPDEDMPGHYTSDLVPTRVGDYAFHLSGTVGTTKIDEKFESGPNRFDAVTDGSGLQFPDTVPSTAAMAKQIADANGKLTVALALGVLGTAGLVVSIYTLARSRRIA